jgi:predicted alpha/beta-fold hydrolase
MIFESSSPEIQAQLEEKLGSKFHELFELGVSMKTVDHYFSCKLSGKSSDTYKDGLDYYDKISYKSYMQDIRTKTLFISDIDDPVIGPGCIPPDCEFKSNPYVALLKTQYGGHVGYFENPLSNDQWITKPILCTINSFNSE